MSARDHIERAEKCAVAEQGIVHALIAIAISLTELTERDQDTGGVPLWHQDFGMPRESR